MSRELAEYAHSLGLWLRDSTLGSDSPILALLAADFTVLLGSLKSGTSS